MNYIMWFSCILSFHSDRLAYLDTFEDLIMMKRSTPERDLASKLYRHVPVWLQSAIRASWEAGTLVMT